jgi:hypothetical protein
VGAAQSVNDGGCRKCRTHLTVARSEDGGQSWAALAVLSNHRQNFYRAHYPTLLQVGCDRLMAVYSVGYSCCAPADAQLGIRLVSFR